MSEEKIINKIVPAETIFEVAEYLEKQKSEYDKLFEKDKQKNENVKFADQIHEYNGQSSKVEYTVKYKDGRELTEKGYEWLEGALSNPQSIQRIQIYSRISYASNVEDKEHSQIKALDINVSFYEDYIRLRVDGTKLEEQANKNYSYIRGLIENNEDRYNKTVKNRNLRIQSFCMSLGYVLAFIMYLLIMANKQSIQEEIIQLINNKYVIIIGQWILGIVLGNLFGAGIMKLLYKNIVPEKKYSHYDKSSRKSVYVDNLDEYIEGDEVHIGKFANNGKNRETIEKIYKVTKIIVMVELIISLALFFILK